MTRGKDNDDPAFKAAFLTLARRTGKSFKTHADESATLRDYMNALLDFDITAVVAAAETMGILGTSDNFFPRVAEWGDACLSAQIELDLAAVGNQKLLAAAPEDAAEEVRLQVIARDKAVDHALERGELFLVRLLKGMDVTTPASTYEAQFYCGKCSDTGSRLRDDLDGCVHKCECRKTNPAWRVKELRAARRERIEARASAAAALHPARPRVALSN